MMITHLFHFLLLEQANLLFHLYHLKIHPNHYDPRFNMTGEYQPKSSIDHLLVHQLDQHYQDNLVDQHHLKNIVTTMK